MKKSSLTLALMFAAMGASATTISLSGSFVYESDGTTKVSTGDYVSVGYFSDGFDFSSIPTLTWDALGASSYTELTGSYGITSDGVSGGGGTATGILGKTLYVWFFADASVPTSPDLIGSQEFGLFSGSGADWTAKGDNPFSDFNNLSVSGITDNEYGSIIGGGVSLSPVPEPSTYAALAGLCALGAVMVRRRRS
ncbi:MULTISPECIES: PEP-CTERM sorting domain-containing protein [unclassified Lentimonas]|uniref:PEP-CTERM sorting domain-containing protein n=1 Tax=unclassified Lentimonas TaxID=2630993 RepID=UPI001FD1387B|nr:MULTISPECIES: PEP-CTERM sorting domain-containing protein [unclassified Lentimonas]